MYMNEISSLSTYIYIQHEDVCFNFIFLLFYDLSLIFNFTLISLILDTYRARVYDIGISYFRN